MVKSVLNALKLVVPIGLAVYLFWTTFSDPATMSELRNSLSKVNWIYIVLTLVVVLISHLSRAYRWQFTIEPLGYKTKHTNAFFALMIGYVVNMLIPRAGEISRAAFFSRYEKIPMDKTLGTIASERIIDIIILLSITALTFWAERDIAWTKAKELYLENRGESQGLNYWLLGILAIGVIGLIFLWRNEKIRTKIKSIVTGLWQGVISIFKMEKKWAFLLHTLIIWGCYILMFYLPFLSLESTSHISFSTLMVGFVFGSFAVILTPGGTGAYHKMVGLALSLYGFSIALGESIGLIIWFAQAIFYIMVGLLCLYLITVTNQNYEGAISTTQE